MSRFVTSQLERGNVGPVNLEEMTTFEKFDHNQTAADEGRFQIHFIRNQITIGQREVHWKYNSECDRDADYSKLIDLHTTKI